MGCLPPPLCVTRIQPRHKYPGWRSGDRALLTVTSALMEQYMKPPALAAMRGGHETILLAEDGKSLRVLVQTALSRLGYPERFAQEALGHNSKAVHRAYAKHALMKLPSLEEYEQQAAAKTTPAT